MLIPAGQLMRSSSLSTLPDRLGNRMRVVFHPARLPVPLFSTDSLYRKEEHMSKDRVRALLTEALRLLGEDEQPAVSPAPASETVSTPAPSPNGDISLIGKVGRPEFMERKGIALWEAGLKIVDDDGRWKWINIQAWRKTAIFARDNLPSAAETTAIGRWKSESWIGNDGEERTREVFVVTHFVQSESPAAH